MLAPTEEFIKDLHRRMLGDVWRWAGKFRVSERNIGIAHWEIPVSSRQLLDDARAWIEYKAYPMNVPYAFITGSCKYTRSRTGTDGTPA